MAEFKSFNVLVQKGKRITRKPFIGDFVKAKSKTQAIKKIEQANKRWNKFSRKAYPGEGFRTKTIKIVKLKGGKK